MWKPCWLWKLGILGACLLGVASQSWDPHVGLEPLTPWGEHLPLWLSSHLWVSYLGVWVWTRLRLHPSSPSCCHSFFISLVVGNLFCSLQVILIDCGCNFGVPVGGGELRVFLLCHLWQHPWIFLLRTLYIVSRRILGLNFYYPIP